MAAELETIERDDYGFPWRPVDDLLDEVEFLNEQAEEHNDEQE
jgi:hypothetical protein